MKPIVLIAAGVALLLLYMRQANASQAPALQYYVDPNGNYQPFISGDQGEPVAVYTEEPSAYYPPQETYVPEQSADVEYTYTMNTTPAAYWKTAEYPKYASAIEVAEDANSIPRDLLARLLYQESHYRADIIDGRTRSGAGATGIAQFMPATAADLGVNPLDPLQSIAGAGRYLKQMFNIFGNWGDALAAYNWGPGNMRNFLQGKPIRVSGGRSVVFTQPPTETRNYVAQISNDVTIA